MHEGHRKRMYEKLVNGSLYEHELLEVLLFNAFQRKNTNPIAHALLSEFGSIGGVLNASVEDLCKVEGVGESVALYLKCIGECLKKSGLTREEDALKNYGDFKRFAAARLSGKKQEVLEIYCLDKQGKVVKCNSYTTYEENRVTVDLNEVSKVIATQKPYGLLIAHNHPVGDPKPSENDDRFTIELQVICSMNGVELYDHIIYSSDDRIYSYFEAGAIDKIKREFAFSRLVDEKFKRTT